MNFTWRRDEEITAETWDLYVDGAPAQYCWVMDMVVSVEWTAYTGHGGRVLPTKKEAQAWVEAMYLLNQ